MTGHVVPYKRSHRPAIRTRQQLWLGNLAAVLGAAAAAVTVLIGFGVAASPATFVGVAVAAPMAAGALCAWRTWMFDARV